MEKEQEYLLSEDFGFILLENERKIYLETAMAGIKRAGVTDIFNGQSDIVLFDAITDYEKVTIATLAGAKSLGQIVQGSTEWTGDEPEVSNILDEQGDIITASVSAGTLGFSFEMADLSETSVKEFLQGTTITTGENTAWESISKIVGFGDSLPVMTRPIMVVNDEANKSILLPKAKITSSLSLSDGLWRIAVSVIAETVDTPNMKTGMLVFGKTAYDE